MKTNQKYNNVAIYSYEISFDPVHVYPGSAEQLNLRESISSSLHSTNNEDIKLALKKLKTIVQHYPQDPVFAGYLQKAYQLTRNKKLSTQTIIENYEKFPNYLFARCAYINYCLENNNINEATKIFDKKFVLKALYPERNLFNINEVIVLADLCIKYFCAKKQIKQASTQLEMIQELIGKDHEISQALESYVFLQGMQLAMEALLKRSKSKKTQKKSFK